MRGVTRLGLVAALVVLAAPAFAGNVTVGRFYTEIAKAKRIVAVDGVSAEAGLRAAGVVLPNLNLGKDLTEGDVTAISNALGLRVTSTRPTQFVSESQMNTFISSFGPQLGASTIVVGDEGATGQAPTDLPPQAENGKGKKKGHNKSTTEPM